MLPPARPYHRWETTGRGRPRGFMAGPGRVGAAPAVCKSHEPGAVYSTTGVGATCFLSLDLCLRRRQEPDHKNRSLELAL